MINSTFFIVGKHAVIEALKNKKRKILKIFLTEESKKNIHRESPNTNLLKDVKVFFKNKKELDKYSTKENILHQGYVAEIEHLEKPVLKESSNVKVFLKYWKSKVIMKNLPKEKREKDQKTLKDQKKLREWEKTSSFFYFQNN